MEVGEWLCLISIKERRHLTKYSSLWVFLYEYVWLLNRWPFLWHMLLASSGHDELCAIDYESWWLFWKKLRCRPSMCRHKGKNNARTSIQVCSCTRSQVAARLVLNLNFTVLSLSWKMMMLLTLSNLKSDNWLMHLVRIIKNANKAAPLRTLMSSKNKHPT